MEVIEIMLRALLAFSMMMIIARLLGKPTIAQMTYHDFVASVTLGAITANIAFNDKIALWKLLISAFSFTLIAYMLMVLAMKNRKMRTWFSGKPTVLIQDGKILEKNMKKLKITLDTLNQELREKDVFNIQEVQFAVLELNGNISVLRTSDHLAVTRKDLNVQSDKQSFPIELIMDGVIIEENLKQNNITNEWLQTHIQRKGLTISVINYAVISSDGSVYIDEYKDKISSPIDQE